MGASEPPGPNCTYGGESYTLSGVVSYVCNGAPGPAGDPGSGVMVNSTSGANTFFASIGTCYNYANGSVSITAPSAGQILVIANVNFIYYHTQGATDTDYLSIGSSSTDCVSSYPDMELLTTPSGVPSFSGALQSFTLTRAFLVSGPGTFTYYVNGEKVSGGTAVGAQDNFNYASMHAIFMR